MDKLTAIRRIADATGYPMSNQMLAALIRIIECDESEVGAIVADYCVGIPDPPPTVPRPIKSWQTPIAKETLPKPPASDTDEDLVLPAGDDVLSPPDNLPNDFGPNLDARLDS